jgi:TP901 family phage tail tape measure protein
MSGVKAVLDPTQDQFDALSGKVKQLGKDSIYSQGEIAKATEELAKNGLNTEQILNGAIDASANFASAAGTNLGTAATVVSDALNIFKISADDVRGAVDQMTGVTIASKFGAEDYALALAQGGAAAKVAGISFEDFNTTVAAIGSAFSSGSDAGTSFKVFTQRLIPTSDNAADAMRNLGLEFFDATGKIKPMREIADELKDGLK